jgi:hypothetical protein
MAVVMAARRFVDELMALLQGELSAMKPSEARAVKLAIRQRWGGEKVYVDKATAGGKRDRLGAELAKGTPLVKAVKAAGLSRRSGYRVLSKKWIVRQ